MTCLFVRLVAYVELCGQSYFAGKIGVCLSLGTLIRLKTVHNNKHVEIMDCMAVTDRIRALGWGAEVYAGGTGGPGVSAMP